MAKELSDLKNLKKATEIRKSGYPTGIHASPHKDLIDKWILEYRWSSKQIVNELKRLFPNEEHPSDRAIDNYRKKYLPLKYLRAAKKSNLALDFIREKALQELDIAKEAYELWQNTKKAINKAIEIMETTNVPPAFLIYLLRVGGQNFEIITNVFTRLGLIKTATTEISVIEKKIYDPDEIETRFERILQIKRRIEEIERRISENDGGIAGELGGGGENVDKGNVLEEHSSNDGIDTGIQKSSSHN